ncbi:3,4-dihydroxy-2-butanone-4-phosphate synthase [Methylonatrum kenyense]|uniref:3,4-dihydroxy-2-butanone-4-phosphate synthase n=1 Tax=Methylonatrum kenyense TaxID=455253 RepID=UPI0020BFD685|nr:3,4-dihydroxy-2-butanone-4-phosphate synthase [Methylonatrum kenyense]MCK8517192.1 3,4-dihydroxy-2-butanone-4-phosphate synthase [Methylonatrum kenyense]
MTPDKDPFSYMLVDPIEEVLDAARRGEPVVLVDNEDRENEGDVVIAAEFATPEVIALMARRASGLICLALTESRATDIGLSRCNDLSRHCPNQTAFTQSIDASYGVTTGISAADRAHTIAAAIDPDQGPDSFCSPGHLFPLLARRGGVLERPGHTEAAVDIARLAGLTAAGVICEIMLDDGSMARLPDLVRFCAEHDLRLGTIADLVDWRLHHDRLVIRRHQRGRHFTYDDLVCGGRHVFSVPTEFSGHVPLVFGGMPTISEVRAGPPGAAYLQLSEVFAPQPGRAPSDVAVAIAAQVLRDVGIESVLEIDPSQRLDRLQRYGIGTRYAQQPNAQPPSQEGGSVNRRRQTAAAVDSTGGLV